MPGLLESVGNTVGNIIKGAGNNLGLLGLGGLSLYGAYQQRSAQRRGQRDLERYALAAAEREKEARAAEQEAAAAEGPNMDYLREAMALQRQQYAQAMKYLKPYYESGLRLLPQKEAMYGAGMKNLGTLGGMMFSPQGLASAYQHTPAYAVKINLPEHLKYGHE